MNYLVIDYSNENEPVKYIIMGHSTVSLVIPYNESAAVKTQNDRTFSTSASYFIE
jgi:muramoyltetrapeptide carboxypeptidase LdcA involved in peptidoglycan recycling